MGKGGELGKCFCTIFIRDKDEPKAINSRIEITKEVVGKAGLGLFDVQVQGKSPLARMLSTVCVGDFTSVYLAFCAE